MSRLHVLARLLAAVVLLVLPSLVRAQEPAARVALVIGNAAYVNVPALANPVYDAEAIAVALRRIGFATVSLRQDLARTEMLEALQSFSRAARSAQMAVVFYAGHGIEIDGRNYLVPVDARLAVAEDAEFEAIPLDLVLRTVEGAKGLRLVLLDACRDNPFLAQMASATGRTRSLNRGLARIEPPGDMLVGYAARDGLVAADGAGAHSPYTTALLRYIKTPGLEIQFLFRKVRDHVLHATGNRQQPHVYGSLGSEAHYLVPPEPTVVAVPSAEEPPVPQGTVELAFWESIRDSAIKDDFAEYLRQFPNGTFAGLARNRLRTFDLAEAPSGPKPDEPVDPPTQLAAIPAPVVRSQSEPTRKSGTDLALVLDMLIDIPCAALRATDDGGRIRVTGYAHVDSAYRAGIERVRSLPAINLVDSDVVGLERAHCEPLQTVAGLVQSVPSGTRAVRSGKSRGLQVEPNRLVSHPHTQIDVYTKDGKVRHLRQQIGSDGKLVVDQADTLDAPEGEALLVLLTSRQPLELDERPEVEATKAYLEALEDVLGAVQPDTVVADIGVLKILPRPITKPQEPKASTPAKPKPVPANAQTTKPAAPLRCSMLLERAQIGERLTDDDRQYIRTNCR